MRMDKCARTYYYIIDSMVLTAVASVVISQSYLTCMRVAFLRFLILCFFIFSLLQVLMPMACIGACCNGLVGSWTTETAGMDGAAARSGGAKIDLGTSVKPWGLNCAAMSLRLGSISETTGNSQNKPCRDGSSSPANTWYPERPRGRRPAAKCEADTGMESKNVPGRDEEDCTMALVPVALQLEASIARAASCSLWY